MKKKLMLVDDHSLFIEGLKYLLETYGFDVVGNAKDGRMAVTKARILKPDIILMDVRMPECNGLEALKLIKAEMPEVKIIMLTTSEDDADLFNAVKYGASGYLLKDTEARTLINMLRDLDHDDPLLSPGLAAKILNEFRRSSIQANMSSQQSSDEKKESLTDRQLEVLELVAAGNTYKEIGDCLGLTERTVKYHMGRILEILHLENRAQVIAYASRKGLIDENI